MSFLSATRITHRRQPLCDGVCYTIAVFVFDEVGQLPVELPEEIKRAVRRLIRRFLREAAAGDSV